MFITLPDEKETKGLAALPAFNKAFLTALFSFST